MCCLRNAYSSRSPSDVINLHASVIHSSCLVYYVNELVCETHVLWWLCGVSPTPVSFHLVFSSPANHPTSPPSVIRYLEFLGCKFKAFLKQQWYVGLWVLIHQSCCEERCILLQFLIWLHELCLPGVCDPPVKKR